MLNTTIAEFANTADSDKTAQPSHLDLQCLPSRFILKAFQNFADVILLSAFLSLYELK